MNRCPVYGILYGHRLPADGEGVELPLMGSGLGEVKRVLKGIGLYVLVSAFLAPACKIKHAAKLDLAAPVGLAAVVVSTTQIDLSWTNIAVDAVTLEIERSVNGGPFTLLVVLPAGQGSYSDTGLTASTEYCYQMRAVNGTKDGPFTAPPVCISTVVVSPVSPTPDAIAGVPGARMGHSMVFEPISQKAYVFGGLTVSGVTDELWILDLSTNAWTLVPTAGLWPSPRMAHSAILDPANNRIITFGGYDGSPGSETDEVWSLDFGGPGIPTWSIPTINGGPATPFPSQGHTAIFYPTVPIPKMIVFGGSGFDFSLATPILINFGEVWELTLPAPGGVSDWTNLSPVTPPPSTLARAGHSAVYDPSSSQMIVFGGNGDVQPASIPLGDVLSFNLASPSWSLNLAGGGPAARYGHSAVLNGTRMLVFGGYTTAACNDLWQLDMGTNAWNPLTLGSSAPSARMGHGAFFNSSGSAMVVFAGGTSPLVPFFLDLFQFGM
jgi:hypothetical protein